MTGHRMGETLEGLFEGRCAESGVSFEEEARELRIPAKALREKLSGRDGFKKAEAEKVGEFLGPDINSWLLTFGPYAARTFNFFNRAEEYIRLVQLPEEEREAEFRREPGLWEDFEVYGEELEAKPISELRALVDDEVQRRGAENLSSDEFASILKDVLANAIKQITQQIVDEVAFRAGETIERLVKEGRYNHVLEGRYKIKTWKPITDFRESAGFRKTRFAQILKGKADIRLSEIARCTAALGVPPSVVIGDVTMEEWRLLDQWRGMGEDDRELVKSLIERLASGPTEGR